MTRTTFSVAARPSLSQQIASCNTLGRPDFSPCYTSAVRRLLGWSILLLAALPSIAFGEELALVLFPAVGVEMAADSEEAVEVEPVGAPDRPAAPHARRDQTARPPRTHPAPVPTQPPPARVPVRLLIRRINE